MPLRLGIHAYAIALIAAIGLASSGCVVGKGLSDTTSTAQQDINPRPADQLRDGGDFRVALTGFPQNFNYDQVDGDDADTYNIVNAVLPTSSLSDAAGNATIDHDYFTDIRLVNTHPQTVVYTIDPRAAWSDGTPMTWADLASQANAMSGRDPRYQIAATTGFDRISSVTRGANDRQAIATFSQPYGAWMGMFSPVYPRSITATPEAFNTADRDGMAVSAGPFRISTVDKVGNRIVLTRNPLWWGRRPRLNTITFLVLDTSTWVPALENNEIDAIEQDEPINTLSQVHQVGNSPDLDLRRALDPSSMTLTFNGAPGAPLSDLKLRLAIAKGIDRAGIVRAVQFGLGVAPTVLNNHIFLLNQIGYQDNSAPVQYNADEAARELDALGWHQHGKVREKNGRPLRIRLAVMQDQARVEIAEILQQNLAAIGVDVDIQSHPATAYFSDVIIPGNFDIGIFGWAITAFPLGSLNQLYSYTPTNPLGNYGRIGNAQINDLVNRAMSELDPVKAIALANTLDQQLFGEVFSLPLFQEPGNYPVRSSVANYGAFGLASIDYTAIGFMR